MHVQFGPYHVRDIKFVAAFDVDGKKVGSDLADAIGASENNTIKFCDVPTTGVIVQRGHTMDGLGDYYRDIIQESDEEPVDVVQALKDAKVDVLISYLPVGSEVADKFYAQCAIDAGVAFVNALPVFIASDPTWAKQVRRGGRADHRRRHQEPGRRDDHAPRHGQAVRGPRRRTAAHVPAELRRQHGLHEHARAQAAAVQEDLQDAVRHLADPARDGEGRRAHRSVRLRAVARRPQVGLRAPRGSRVRRHAAQPRVQARGVGLTEQRRRHHRRSPRGHDREGPRYRRPDPVRRPATS